MAAQTLKTSDTVFESSRFSALIVTWRSDTDWEGVPEMTPVFAFKLKPSGKDPDTIEYVTESPVTDGVCEKNSSCSME